MSNSGKEYEKFVALVYQEILKSESEGSQKNINVELNKKLVDKFGINREFDIYWEYDLAGINYKTVIECKDYNSLISIEKIDSLVGKIKDIPGLTAIFATRKGYQSGAERKAESNNIPILIVREQNDSDWKDVDGTPFLREVSINLVMYPPPRIKNLEFVLDEQWAKGNIGSDLDSINNSITNKLKVMSNEIFIENEDCGDKCSVYDLTQRLKPLGDRNYGEFEKEERFDSGWISGESFRYKIRGYKITYLIGRPSNHCLLYDFSDKLIGVIEDIHKKYKKRVFHGGILRKSPIA